MQNKLGWPILLWARFGLNPPPLKAAGAAPKGRFVTVCQITESVGRGLHYGVGWGAHDYIGGTTCGGIQFDQSQVGRAEYTTEDAGIVEADCGVSRAQ